MNNAPVCAIVCSSFHWHMAVKEETLLVAFYKQWEELLLSANANSTIEW